MKTYKVFTHPSGSTQAVKTGWSWPAFFVPHFWALFKRLWGLALGASLVLVAVAFISEDVDANQIGPLLILAGAEFAVRIIFGANGNSWREVNLISRGFTETNVVTVGAAEGPMLKRMKDPWRHPRVKALWHDPVWSKVIAAGLIAVALSVAAYVHHAEDPTPAIDPSKPKYIPTCTTALLEGDVEMSADEAIAWFEWGPTPALGNVTERQTVTDGATFYQHLAGLTESTRYYYRVMAEDVDGRAAGKVLMFETARCESPAPAR